MSSRNHFHIPIEIKKSYTENPTFALMAKDESIDGLAGLLAS
jgi:hypothetical protein